MKTELIVFGTLSHPGLREAADEYVKRLGKDFSEKELKEVRLPDKPSEKEILRALDEEAEKIFSRLSGNPYLISLCVEGRKMTSEALASLEEGLPEKGYSSVVYVIGSSYGLSDRVKKASALCLSLSDMTLPHQIARLVLLEQIYRAKEIRKGSRYHK